MRSTNKRYRKKKRKTVKIKKRGGKRRLRFLTPGPGKLINNRKPRNFSSY